MKVLGVTPLYPPDSRVGAWLSTHECLRRLVERGHDVSVRTGLANRGYTHDGIDVAGVGSTVSQHLEGVDVVVSHLGDEVTNTATAARAAGVPHVVMVHGEPTRQPDADLVVFNSAATAATATSWGIPSVTVRPHVDLDQHRCTPGDSVTLVNLSASKGVQLFNMLAAAEPHRQFLGVAGGYGRQVRKRRHNVEFSPVVADMRDVWSRTRVLLMPSLNESWGRVGVEAMCSGIPVVAHPTPGLLESLGPAGIFVDRTDVAGWREVLAELDEPETYEARSKACREWVAGIDTATDLDVFCDALEALVGIPA